MPFLDLLSTERVRTDLVAADKTDLLGILSGLLAVDADERRKISDALVGREKLGSTGLGRGVAMPHGRIPGLDRPRAAFVRLASPLDFDSVDAQPVDLVAALVVPTHFTDQHLQLLAELAEIFSDNDLTLALRSAPDSSALLQELAEFGKNRTKGPAWTD